MVEDLQKNSNQELEGKSEIAGVDGLILPAGRAAPSGPNNPDVETLARS
jgi:hypothetical protein